MKHILIITSCSFLFFVCFSQKRKRNIDLNDLSNTRVELYVDKNDIKIPIAFSKILVFDKRSDATIIGLDKSRKEIIGIRLQDETEITLNKFLNELVIKNKNADKELVMIIRKLWVSNEIENDKVIDKYHKDEKEFMSGVIAKFEFYIKNEDNYSPLYRYDTIMMVRENIKYNIASNLRIVFADAINKINQPNIQSKSEKSRKRNWQEIDSFSSSQNSAPILTTSVLKRGVYRSFNEFINNEPSIENYMVKDNPQGSTIIIKDNEGQEYSIKKVWGVCNGEKIFIQFCNNFFELARKENTFFTMAAKKVTYSDGMYSRDSHVLSQTTLYYGNIYFFYYDVISKMLVMQPLLLDMESGILY